MEEEKVDSEEKIEEMFLGMGSYMTTKLNKGLISIKKRLEEIKNSEKKNKAEIEIKLTELIEVMTKIHDKTKIQTDLQKELFDLMNQMAKLDSEVDDLLIKNGN